MSIGKLWEGERLPAVGQQVRDYIKKLDVFKSGGMEYGIFLRLQGEQVDVIAMLLSTIN